MKLATFRSNGSVRVGALRGADEVVELDGFNDMLSLIEGGSEALARAQEALGSSSARAHGLREVELLPPLPVPRGNVIAIGRNYEAHAAESARKDGHEPEPPTIFTKAITSLTEPFADIAIDPAVSEKIDWEVELAFVVGKQGVNIDRHAAREHVFGYMVLNDVSARDIQTSWGGQYFKGKSLDRSCPTGPFLVTADEVPDPQALRLKLSLDGEVKQDGTTHDMIYSIDALLEWVSKGMTLLPGTIIATGTPEGVGQWRTPSEYLRPGQVMESEVEGVGVLRNRIVSAAGD